MEESLDTILRKTGPWFLKIGGYILWIWKGSITGWNLLSACVFSRLFYVHLLWYIWEKCGEQSVSGFFPSCFYLSLFCEGCIRILTVRNFTQIRKREKKILKTLNKEGIKRIAIVGFEKRFLYSLTVFQFFFFVTFNIMLRRYICWTRSCNFIIDYK